MKVLLGTLAAIATASGALAWRDIAAPQTPPGMSLVQAQQALVKALTGMSEAIGPSIKNDKSAAAQVKRVSAMLDQIEKADKSARADGYSPAAVVASVGADRTTLFQWVRDQTALVPYRGSLRGPVGVLMDRRGNSLDRALLLADLLERAGHDVRLANGPLDTAERSKVDAAIAARARPGTPARPMDDLSSTFGPAFPESSSQIQAQFASLETARQQVVAQARARIAQQTTALLGVVPPSTQAAGDLDAVNDHWWVQVSDRGGWIDLDPTLPGAKPGETLAQPLTTLAPKDIDDDRRHTLTVRVMAEAWRDGTRSEEQLLEHVFVPSQFFGQQIVFTNIPVDWPSDDELIKSKNPAERARAAVLDQVEWVPILRVGKSVVARNSITDHGELHDNSSPDANATRLARNIARMTKVTVTAAVDLLASLPSGDTPEPAPAKRRGAAAFTSEWIEFEMRAPGLPPVRAKRMVFDAMTPARRQNGRPQTLTEAERLQRSLALLGETELLPMFAAIPASYVNHLTATRLLAARPAIVELVRGAGKPVDAALREKLITEEAAPSALYGLAVARFEWNTHRDDVYLSGLNLISKRREFRSTANGPFAVRNSFDIIANTVASMPRAGAAGFRAAVEQGVTDTVAESGLLLECMTPSPECTRGPNTSDAFAAARTQGWSVIAGTAVDFSRVPASARNGVRADLAAGYIVVMPTAPQAGTSSDAAWWRIDPRTGETLGMTEQGGSVSTEHLFMLFTVGVRLVGCVPLLRHGFDDSYGDVRAMACLMTGLWGGGLVLAALTGTALGAVGAATTLLLTALGVDWPGVFGL